MSGLLDTAVVFKLPSPGDGDAILGRRYMSNPPGNLTKEIRATQEFRGDSGSVVEENKAEGALRVGKKAR